jgi:hypothetical protein
MNVISDDIENKWLEKQGNKVFVIYKAKKLQAIEK